MRIDDVTQTKDYYFFILIYEGLCQFRQVMNIRRILCFCFIITMFSTHQHIQDHSYKNRTECIIKLSSLKQSYIKSVF